MLVHEPSRSHQDPLPLSRGSHALSADGGKVPRCREGKALRLGAPGAVHAERGPAAAGHLAKREVRPYQHVLVDEAQEMGPDVLSELRILSSTDFDATSLLTVVLSGDGRLLERLRQEDLVPLETRIRTRLKTDTASREELCELLGHSLAKAGNASLMSNELMDTLVDHAAGNYRLLMTMGAELLAYGMAHEVEQLDEKFYLEVFQPVRPRSASKKKVRA